MNPYYQKDDITVYHGNALDVLKAMPDESVQLIITSPPYLGLRSYLLEPQVWDGDKDCVHLWTNPITTNRHKKGETNPGKEAWYKEKDGISQTAGCFCSKCGAWKGCLGLEPDVNLYLQHLLQITAELKRVLKKNGQFWLNIGDSYGGNMGFTADTKSNAPCNRRWQPDKPIKRKNTISKCLLQIPERLSTKMVDEQGWILRNKVRWIKQIYIKKQGKTIGSVMPTSVKDRFNESAEDFYFFTKSKKYYSNLDSVRIPNQVVGVTDMRPDGHIRCRELQYDSKYRKDYSPQFKQSNVRKSQHKFKGMKQDAEMFGSPRARNERQYDISKRQKELVEGGVISSAQRIRGFFDEFGGKSHPLGKGLPSCWLIGSEPHNFSKELGTGGTEHFATFPQSLVHIPILFGSAKGDTILEPFCGSGTVGLVAQNLNRKFIGIELSQDYIDHIIIPRFEQNKCQLTLFD